MQKPVLIAGLIVIVLGAFWVWSVNEAKNDIYRKLNSWPYIFSTDAQITLHSQLNQLNVEMAYAQFTVLAGVAVTIVGAVIDRKKTEVRTSDAHVNIRCLKCDGLNNEKASFCIHCGARLKQVST